VVQVGEQIGPVGFFDFKTLAIEPTHCTIRMYCENDRKSWAVEGADDGVSLTEIDWREDNSGRAGDEAVKAFAVSRSESFERIPLRQNGLNHNGNNSMVFTAFKVFGAVAGLQ
jgi:hypothetical protein